MNDLDQAEHEVIWTDATIADRSALTADLPRLSREAALLFDEVEDLLAIRRHSAGDAFVVAYLASTGFNDRGHGPSPEAVVEL